MDVCHVELFSTIANGCLLCGNVQKLLLMGVGFVKCLELLLIGDCCVNCRTIANGCKVTSTLQSRKNNRRLLFVRKEPLQQEFRPVASCRSHEGGSTRIVNPDVFLLLYRRFDQLPSLTSFFLGRFPFSLSFKGVVL